MKTKELLIYLALLLGNTAPIHATQPTLTTDNSNPFHGSIVIECEDQTLWDGDNSNYATSMVDSVTNSDQLPSIQGIISGNGFAHFVGRNSTANPEVAFYLENNNVRAHQGYDIAIVVLPENAVDATIRKPRGNKFTAELLRQCENETFSSYQVDDSVFCSDPSKVDTIVLFRNVILPPHGLQTSLKLTSAVSIRERDTYGFSFYLDCIVLAINKSETPMAFDNFESDGLTWQVTDEEQRQVSVCYGGEAQGDISIPSTVTHDGKTYHVAEISDDAFAQNTKLTSITLPTSIRRVGQLAFYDCNRLEALRVEEGNEHYCSFDGVLYNRDTTHIAVFPTMWSGEYDIPHTVTCINDFTFMGCPNLTSLSIPHTVTHVADRAFSNISVDRLYLNMPTVRTIKGFTSRRHVEIGDAVRTIETSSFEGDTTIESVIIHEGIKIVKRAAFHGCVNLQKIHLSSTLTEVWPLAFANTGIKEIDIPSIQTLCNSSFGECKHLKRVAAISRATASHTNIHEMYGLFRRLRQH